MRALAIALTAFSTSAVAEPVDQRDPDVALGATIAGAVGAGVLIGAAGDHRSAEWKPATIELVAAVAAPTLGHLYAGDYLSIGLGLRVVGGGLMALGAYKLAQPYDTGSPSIEFSPLGGWLCVGGLAAFATGTIYDIATSRREARRFNREHATFVPMPLQTPSGTSPGMAFVGRF